MSVTNHQSLIASRHSLPLHQSLIASRQSLFPAVADSHSKHQARCEIFIVGDVPLFANTPRHSLLAFVWAKIARWG
ncbi:MAG: hypothetical protein PVTTEEND_000895 [Candidatus Fervidibacter sp.]